MKFTAVILFVCSIYSTALADSGLISIDMGTRTISKVRTALRHDQSYIVASTYQGAILAIGYDGKVRWENALSGFMNHDVWCADITGDGIDEVLAANADGSAYCLGQNGRLLWTFKANDAPMYSVCVVSSDGVSYVVCGGLDKSFYYVSNMGKQVKKIHSSTYSKEKTWGKGPKRVPPKGVHTVNFLRRMRGADGKDVLVVHGVINSMSGSGSLYLFTPLADKPDRILPLPNTAAYGDLRVRDTNGDGVDEILLGTSSMAKDAAFVSVNTRTGKGNAFAISGDSTVRRNLDNFGYRVVQSELVRLGGRDRTMLLLGSRMVLMDQTSGEPENLEVLKCRYSFNDMWREPQTQKIILASSQSGGSCIHIIDMSKPEWKQAYESITPPGKIAAILRNSETVVKQVANYEKPVWQRDALPVYFMTDSIPKSRAALVESIHKNLPSPVFLKGHFMRSVENWDRSGMANEKYRERRDRRKQYGSTGDQIVNSLKPVIKNYPGISYWGGHGNDPYMLSLDTQKKIVDAANGKKVVSIYPELEDPSEDFGFVLNDLIFPLAEYYSGKNANIFIRTKHLFWQSSIYEPIWSRFMTGEFSDVFVASMEETSDKSMELSLAARMGVWTSGVVDDWGARCARDNTSFDRLRQHSHQMLPNHFLRYQIYNIASGARYLNNFNVDQEYMSVLWSLIAKGALFVPKREEIISFNPVHLSMIKPDPHYLDEGNNVKWTLFYDEKFENENPFIFSRLNGTWPGAPVNQWDFSRYAAGVKERRLNFLPPYANGMVLITPEQKSRKTKLQDNLHPLYKNILKEYVTDGRHYYSQDRKTRYAADSYYKTIEQDIAKNGAKIPLTVSGNVAWVAAVTSPRHIRLTLVDSGYINPGDKTATIMFNTVTPVTIIDVLSGEKMLFKENKSAEIEIPCGLFRFVDIETRAAL